MRRTKLIAAIVLAPLLAVIGFFVLFALVAQHEIERRGLSEKQHNAVKHAFAAAEVYARTRPLIGDADAAAFALRAGDVLEGVEPYTNHDVDWASEAYKDMRNNLHGVVAARWLRSELGISDSVSRLRLIGWLAQAGELAFVHNDPRLPDLPDVPDLARARSQIRADEDRLVAEFAAALEARRAEITRDLGLVSP